LSGYRDVNLPEPLYIQVVGRNRMKKVGWSESPVGIAVEDKRGDFGRHGVDAGGPRVVEETRLVPIILVNLIHEAEPTPQGLSFSLGGQSHVRDQVIQLACGMVSHLNEEIADDGPLREMVPCLRELF
jgi:hypothetical protein